MSVKALDNLVSVSRRSSTSATTISLLDFVFTVECKSGATNMVADALSCRDTDEVSVGALLAVSGPRFDFITRLRHAQATDLALVAVHDEVTVGTRTASWALTDGLVTFDGRTYRRCLHCCWRSWLPSTTTGTRGSNTRCTVCAVTFIFPTCDVVCRTLCGNASLATPTVQDGAPPPRRPPPTIANSHRSLSASISWKLCRG